MRKVMLIFTMFTFFVYAAPRKVMGEMFTSTTCAPCRQGNIYVDNLVGDHWDSLSMVRYHVWWPSPGDPFYDANRGQNKARVSYYGINAVPSLVIDGTLLPSYTYGGVTYEERIEVPSPVYFRMYVRYPLGDVGENGAKPGKVLFHIVPDTTIMTDTLEYITGYLHLVVVEDSIQYSASNGLKEHSQTMQEMFPNATGEVLKVENHREYVKEMDFNVDTAWVDTLDGENIIPCDENHVQVVGFYQAMNKEVYNSEHFYVLSGADDFNVSIEDVTLYDPDKTLEPGDTVYIIVKVKNKGSKLNNLRILVSTDPESQFIKQSIYVGELGVGKEYTNGDDPLIFIVPEDADPNSIEVTVYVADDDTHRYETSTVTSGNALGVSVLKDDDVSVEYSSGVLKLKGYRGYAVMYDITGKIVGRWYVHGETSIPVNRKGILFLKLSHRTVKIVNF